jgi:hypothetical protein
MNFSTKTASAFAALAILAASAYRYPVRISNGSVGYAGEASFNVTGRVGANGAVIVTVSRGNQSASGSGMLSSSDGSGYWRTASGECSGTWTAERRG